ncbi:hypothetical protein YC2023_078733 [Brassica napus]
MQNLQGPRHLQIIRLLAWQCTLYYIWAERNSRLHRHIFKPPDSIVKQIEATIRSKISALRDRSPRLSSSLFAVWNEYEDEEDEDKQIEIINRDKHKNKVSSSSSLEEAEKWKHEELAEEEKKPEMSEKTVALPSSRRWRRKNTPVKSCTQIKVTSLLLVNKKSK